MTIAKADDGIGRRRVPRRTFKAQVGVLLGGEYICQKSYQLGEGGMMIDYPSAKLEEGMQMVLSFFLPNGGLVIVRGVVRAVVAAKEKTPERYGLEFQNLGFQHKRAIRNFVAAATREDAHALIF